MNEFWLVTPRWPAYEVSNFGNIRRPGYSVKPQMLRNGYLNVRVYDQNEIGTTLGLHRLVLEAFVPQPSKLHVVCHKNGYPNDNRVANLYWGTRSENAQDIATHGAPETRFKVKLTVTIEYTVNGPRQRKQYRLINQRSKSD